MNDDNVIIAIFVIIILITFLLFFGFFFVFIETLYGRFFHKPFFVHCYLFSKRLNKSQVEILESKFQFYQKLSPRKKRYFEHRVAVFVAKYPFYGKQGLVVTQEKRILIAATSTMLTFGMRNYTYTVFDKIILYPDVYYSQSTEQFHKGEFNPTVKALVFSWKHFQEGHELTNDNLNLGLHEFMHTLHFQIIKNHDVSSFIYKNNYKQLVKEVNHPPNKNRLIASDYFRNYAFSNELEFIAVILENFFETPETFKREFPELYLKVKRMINYSEQ